MAIYIATLNDWLIVEKLDIETAEPIIYDSIYRMWFLASGYDLSLNWYVDIYFNWRYIEASLLVTAEYTGSSYVNKW